jgi:leader peptidase (prepilin peptidase) / N-methyltransferase
VIPILPFVAVIGLVFGSFLGVCVYRIPRGISVIQPGSFCPHCKRKLAWRDLVPVFSLMINRGKCRECGEKVSQKYSAIEITTSIAFVFLYLSSEWDPRFLERCLFVLALIPVIWIDWEFWVIPNSILVLGGSATVLAHLFFSPTDIIAHLTSAGAALAGMTAVRILGGILFRKPALGMGDVKLSGFLAFELGIVGFLVTLWLAAVGGLICAVGLTREAYYDGSLSSEIGAASISQRPIPFGSFLCAAAILVLLLSDRVQQLVEIWLISI